MYRNFFSEIARFETLFKRKRKRGILIFFVLCWGIMCKACGQAFFPIELNVKSRSERNDKQEKMLVELVPLTDSNTKRANRDPYKRRIIDAGNLEKPAKIIPEASALLEHFPTLNDPGPYLIGVGDLLTISKVYQTGTGLQSLIKREIVVKESGLINISEIGSVRAEGLTQSQLEDAVYQRMVEEGQDKNFEINIAGFNSKRVVVIIEGRATASVPYSSIPMFLEQVLIEQKIVRNLLV